MKLAQLKHVNVNPVIILIMEYASGGELFDLLCQEIVNNKIINNIIILLYFYSLQKKKLDVYFNK